MANEEKILLEISNLRKYFPIKGIKGPGVQAVQDVSFYIKKGETLGLGGGQAAARLPLGGPSCGFTSRRGGALPMTARRFTTIL